MPADPTSRLWTYPWDILDLGMERFQAELRERAGVGGVSVATSYHAGYFLQPRSPRRRFYLPEDGTVYYALDHKRWADRAIRPLEAALVREGGDVLSTLIAERERGGASVNCWTVCLHNTRLGTSHPEAAPENAFGDRTPFALCPSHPEARAYVRTLVGEIAERYRPDAIELETPSFMGFAHGFHHEKDGVGLTPEDDFLLSLCFCPSCLARAKAAGVDGEAARRTVRTWICEALERPVPAPRWPDFIEAGPNVFRDHEAVHRYVLWRRKPVASLIAGAHEAAGGHSRVNLIDFPGSWTLGVDLALAGQGCDGVLYCAYDMSPAQTGATVAGVVAALPPDVSVEVGMRLFVPELSGGAALRERVQAALLNGAQGFNFYNYGLVPAARLDWVREALQAT